MSGVNEQSAKHTLEISKLDNKILGTQLMEGCLSPSFIETNMFLIAHVQSAYANQCVDPIYIIYICVLVDKLTYKQTGTVLKMEITDGEQKYLIMYYEATKNRLKKTFFQAVD